MSAFSEHDVTTIFLKGQRQEEVTANVGGNRIIFLEQEKSSLRGIKLGSIWQLCKLFQSNHYDVVIAHRYKAIYLAGIMRYFFSIPVILGVAHELEVFRRRTRSLFVSFWRRNIVVVGVSETVSRNVARYCKSLLPQNRLFTLPNVIDLAEEGHLLSRAEARQQLGLKENDCVIGSIGRLVAKKRHEVLIKGFAELANQRLKLLIVGEGPRRKELQELAEKLGVEQQVVFAGFHARANRLVKAIDVFVLSSGEEAFGVVILEAMLGKIPVVSSDVSGPVDVLGGTGTLFCQGDTVDLANRLAFLVKQTDDERKRSAEAGYIRVKQEFGYESFRKKVWSLPDLQQVLIE